MGSNRVAYYTAEVAGIAASVDGRIAVEELMPQCRFGNANAIIGPRYRREIKYGDYLGGISPPPECNHATITIGTINPLKAGGVAIFLMKCGFPLVEAV